MFCCRLACHDTLEVPQYHRGGAGVVYLLFIWNMFCCRFACHDTLEVPQYHSLSFIWNMFCCRLACHDTLEVPQYHRGGGGSVFVVYLEHVLLSTCLPRHSRSTTVPQGGAGGSDPSPFAGGGSHGPATLHHIYISYIYIYIYLDFSDHQIRSCAVFGLPRLTLNASA